VSERDFKAWAEDQAKTERQREDAEAAGGGGGGEGAPPGSSSAANTPATEDTLQKILTKIQERPILVA
jgi:hypothetical protein